MSELKLKNVGYRYSDAAKDEYVFKNISYEFERGKIYAIKGKSGSGKTTLLSLLSGLEKPSEGQIIYENNDLSKMNLDKYRSNNIGIIFQTYNLLPHLTAIENLILSMDVSGLKIKNKNIEAIRLLETVGIDDKKSLRKILRLSGGEQQRVAIARSLSYNPSVILADEPTGNLDKETEEEVLKIFKTLAKKQNKCIIIVTHSDNVASKADFVFDLNKEIEVSK